MELVLGVDNLVFLALVTARVAKPRQGAARRLGLALALILRLALLAGAAWLVGLTAPLFQLLGHGFSLRDLVLLGGGFFLLFKATQEIHDHVEGRHDADAAPKPPLGFGAAIAQIVALDLVFSVDSIVTAVGMTDNFPVMATAVIIVIFMMALAAGPLSRFITSNPTLVMLALGFLLMIGMVLIADGFGLHVPKGYIYAAFLFSGGVEALNTLRRVRGRRNKS
ncbi:MAG: TerC family protein [Pseudomonadota bacterium]|nr:TerC family protein [Pseudomonadota bacterium]